MKIQVTLYTTHGKQLTRETVDIDDDRWNEMDFLEKEDACKRIVERAFCWHWRELEENEAGTCLSLALARAKRK